MEENKKYVNVELSLLNIEAYLQACISMQAQIIAKLENRDKAEVFDNAMNGISKTIQKLFEDLPDK